ncbi:MAG: putative lipid II flippase FtsW [Lachnospiraceae bacterium]|nr:putative lipid II flippase FtsW [Lachnospiraceae bacterium]
MKFRTKDQDGAKPYIDYSLIFITLFLVAFGLVMVYSTSSYDASMSVLTNNDPAYYLKKQAAASVFGFVLMAVFGIIPYNTWEKVSGMAYAVSAILILLVLTPLGYEANGARRWLRLGISIQPAEIAKLAMIIFVAGLICKLKDDINTRKGMIIVLAPPALICLLVWQITDNLSSAIIIFGISFVMLFIASRDYKKFAIFAAAAAALAALLVYAITKAAGSNKFGFRGDRVLAWLDPEAYASGKGFQTLQALYAIGSGGIFGKGLGQSIQKQGFLPEAQNDMIFSVICEELGLFGGISIVLLFALLLWRLMIIATNATDLYGALLVVGVMAHISIQVVLNIAVVTNTVPNTGISLPFISYGGSSIMFLLIEIGLVNSVARKIRF